ncbi:MAG: four helix bundle protein [Bacteroidota bacterium]
MNNYKNLKVWQKSVDLAVKVYELTQSFPKEEAYGLTSQIRRSAVSVASNVAEGSGRNSSKDFRNFLGIAHGSCYELETQIIIANKIGLLDRSAFETIQNDIIEVQKMNFSLKNSLEN